MPPADGTWIGQGVDTSKIELTADLKDKDVVWEKTTILYTFVYPERFIAKSRMLRNFLHQFGRETDRGEVVFEFDGEFYRIRREVWT